MATVGNNSKSKPAEVRDAFFDSGEKIYLEEVNWRLNHYGKIKGMSNFDTIKKYEIYNKMKTKLSKSKHDKYLKQAVLEILATSLQHKSLRDEPMQDKNYYVAEDIDELYKKSPEAKAILCEMIHECVEDGAFTPDEMEFVENELLVMLATIEDLHLEKVLELER